MNDLRSISVFGLGKLGACMAGTFAQRGFEVLGVDINPDVVRAVNNGVPPVDEPGLPEIFEEAGGRLHASMDPGDALTTDVSFFIVPTYSLPDGSFSNELLMRAIAPLARALRTEAKSGHMIVVSSTTTPGSCRDVVIPMIEKELEGKCGIDFGFSYNPQFIALGDVVKGLLAPDLVLIGESDPSVGEKLERFFRVYNLNQPRVARMSITSAELTKISVNSYITAKISFTNQLRMIAERYDDTDIHAILGAIGADSRIGSKYLHAGLSYGGPCFPRDNRLLSFAARQVGASAPLAEASDLVNEQAKDQLARQALECTQPGDVVAVLGMAYRPDTYIVEESAGLHVAQMLQKAGRRVLVHDFAANAQNSPSLLQFEIIEDVKHLSAMSGVAATLICCPWVGYRDLPLPDEGQVFDPWGMLVKTS